MIVDGMPFACFRPGKWVSVPDARFEIVRVAPTPKEREEWGFPTRGHWWRVYEYGPHGEQLAILGRADRLRDAARLVHSRHVGNGTVAEDVREEARRDA